MKSFIDYLSESKKSWKFKVKTIHELTDEQSDRIEKHLMKYDSKGLGAVKKTILQSTLRDFPSHKGYEVYMYEFETNLPVSGFQVKNEIQNMLGLQDGVFKIKGEHEPEDDMLEESSEYDMEKNDSKLNDSDYSEADKVKTDDYYGDKYNTSFVQELLKLRKEKDKDNE